MLGMRDPYRSKEGELAGNVGTRTALYGARKKSKPKGKHHVVLAF